MPRFLTSHEMACMTRQGAQHLAASFPVTGEIRFVRLLINMTEGRLFGEFEAPDRQALAAWLASKSVHHDWVTRIDIEVTPEGVRDL
jgi:hypothetical protein